MSTLRRKPDHRTKRASGRRSAPLSPAAKRSKPSQGLKKRRGPAAGRKTPQPDRNRRLIPATRSKLSVIISARDEEETIYKVLEQVTRLEPSEIIVVLNGCKDRSFQRARLCKAAIIVHCPESAGHDVGRAIGAKLSRGDILLFLDGDMVIPANYLAMFAAAIERGIDVALNDIDPLLPAFALWDDVTRCKLFLNSTLERPDLGTGSMTAVPHALSRRAAERIGYPNLMVPPKAQAIAIMEKLRVEKVGTVDVIKHNRQRKANTGAGNVMAQLIAGDHAEAVHEVLERGWRRLPDGGAAAEHRRLTASWRNGL